MSNRRPYCTHARLETDPDDGRGCPSCEVEARHPEVAFYARARRGYTLPIVSSVRAVLRVFGPYLVVIAVLVALGLVAAAIESL